MSAPHPPHSVAHRISLGASIAVLVALAVVLLTSGRGDDPADPVAEVTSVAVATDGSYHVVVGVENEGDRAADAVQVAAALTIGEIEHTGDQTIDFLGAGERRELVFVFADDPATGTLEVAVTGFTRP